MKLKSVLLLCFVMLGASAPVLAQCAMCSTQLENNFTNGTPGIASGMNIGIMYLLIMPYLGIFILGYFWYKTSKNGRKQNSRSPSR